MAAKKKAAASKKKRGASDYKEGTTSTEKSERYLAFLDAWGPNTPITHLCRAANCTHQSVYRWRKDLPTFKEREQEIKDKWDKPIGAPPNVNGVDTEGLDTIEAKWLIGYRDTKDRNSAAEQAGVTWKYIEARIKRNDKLREQYEAIHGGLIVASEDAILRKGANGDVSAAKVVLQANHPRYRNQLKIDQHTTVDVMLSGDETIRELGGWMKKFGRLKPAGEFRQDRALTEAIEVEAVAVP